MSEHERLDDLVERHLRNELSGEEKQQLAALLDSDAEATQ